MQVLSRSILLAVATRLCVNAIDDRSLLDTVKFESMTGHEMLHSTRRLTVDDVQSMPMFTEFDRKKQSSNPKIGPSLHELISDDALGLVTQDYYFKHGLIANLHGGSKTVLVEVVGDTIENIEEVLVKNGFKVLSCYKHMCSMYVSIDDITELARLQQVTNIHATMPSFHAGSESVEDARRRKLQGSVTGEGLIAHNIDKARVKYNVNGTGILIGIVGLSFNCFTGAANDTLSGDLPPSSRINIITDLNATECASRALGGFDDIRSELQVLYDIVPGARFATYAARSELDAAKGIVTLANVGCDIIMDNIFNDAETWFQDGPMAQAVEDVVDRGVAYFQSAAGGYRPGTAWDAPSGFVPSGVSPPNSTGQFHLFGNTSSGSPIISQRIGIPNTGSNAEIVIFQWDQPSFKVSGPPGCQSDLDIILSINGTNRMTYSITTSNIGGDSGEGGFVVPVFSSTNSTVFYDIFIVHKIGPFPKYMKIIVTSSTGRIPIYEFATNTTTLVGKANSEKSSGVCLVRVESSPVFNVTPPVASRIYGLGNPIVYDRFGNRTLTPIIRKPTRFCAISNAAVANPKRPSQTFTSQVHAAGIAALMLQARGGPKSLTPQQIQKFLEITAIDMDDQSTPGFDVGFDTPTGFGFIDALAALDAATATKAPTKAPTKRPTKAPTKKPTKSPTKLPTKTPTKLPTTAPTKTPTTAPVRPDCGLFRWNIFCPTTRCGLIGRLLRLCIYQ